MAPQPFELKVSDAAIADLKTRLSLTRFPDAAPGEPWAYGSSVDYMRDLVSYWKDSFDWRAQEAALNEFPQFKVPLHDIDLHYLHVPGVGPRRRRTLLTTFGSLAGVRRATREELESIVGKKVADAVLAFFAGRP